MPRCMDCFEDEATGCSCNYRRKTVTVAAPKTSQRSDVRCSEWVAALKGERNKDAGIMKQCAKKKNREMTKYYQGRMDALDQVINWMRSGAATKQISE